MMVEMSDAQFDRLITTLRRGGGGGAAGEAGAAVVVGPMGPCVMGKDKLKRPKKWTDWHKDAENKMRFIGITESDQKLNFLRSCAGAELTGFWEKEVRVLFEVKREEGQEDVPAHTYEEVVASVAQLCQNVLRTGRLYTPVFVVLFDGEGILPNLHPFPD